MFTNWTLSFLGASHSVDFPFKNPGKLAAYPFQLSWIWTHLSSNSFSSCACLVNFAFNFGSFAEVTKSQRNSTCLHIDGQVSWHISLYSCNKKQGFLIMGIVPGNRGLTNPFFSTMAHTSPSACVSTGYHTHLSPWLTMVTKKSSPYLLIAVFFSHISARLHSQPWTVWSSCFLF